MKQLLVFLCIVVVFILCVTFPKEVSTNAVFTVVVDAGHGGMDRGASRNGTHESDVNLAIALFLKSELQLRGAAVVMTRENKDWLASDFAPNKKKDDMNNRRMIIERTKPDLVISIHLNTFPSESVRGLQCFYDGSGETSKDYADAIQTEFNKSMPDINRIAKSGDYYILNCTTFPSVLVECGFLSNPQEEKLLGTAEYQKILAYYIASAVCRQFLATHILQ